MTTRARTTVIRHLSEARISLSDAGMLLDLEGTDPRLVEILLELERGVEAVAKDIELSEL